MRLVLILLLIASPAFGARLQHESVYQQQWCSEHGGTVPTSIGWMRPDCITDTQAIEFDFADKYREGIIQALEYAGATDLRASLVLIIEQPTDIKYYRRAESVIERYDLPIDLLLTGAGL